jgi:hypothetical protein
MAHVGAGIDDRVGAGSRVRSAPVAGSWMAPQAEALEAYWEQLATWIDQDHPQRTRVSNCSINRACRLPT